MLSKEDYILVELLGKDTPEVRALVAAAANPDMQGAVHGMLRSLAGQKGLNPDDPPRFGLPHGISPSDVVLGSAMSGGVVGEMVGPSEVDFPSHIGVFGMTAVGKTTLVKLLLLGFSRPRKSMTPRTFFVLDLHGEYRDLLRLYGPDELVWMNADDLNINPFEVPKAGDGSPAMAPHKWINHIREWLRLFWLNEPSCNLFCEILGELYRERGVFEGKDVYPSLSEIIEALRRLKPARGSDRERARGKLLDRLESLRASLPGLDVQKSRNFCELLNRSVILDLSDVKDVALPVLFSLLATLLRETQRSDEEPEITRILVMEEAHEILGGQLDKRTSDLKGTKPSGVLRDLRKCGTCGVVVSQLISDVAASVLGNLGTIVSFRQGHRDCVRQAAAALNLAPWQEREIGNLPNRHAIARLSRYGSPMYLAVKDARAPFPEGARRLSRAEARETSKAVLESIPFVKCEAPKQEEEEASRGKGGIGGGTPEPATGGLPLRERQVFAHIAERPWTLIEARMDALGLDRDSEHDARARLEDRGLTAFAGKVGAKHVLTNLSARGRTVAKSMGLAVAKAEKGSVVHKSIVYYTELALSLFTPAFKFRRTGVSSTTLGVQPDALLILPNGGRVPIQACAANQPAYEAGALLKLHKLAELQPEDPEKVDFVLAVAVNKRHRDAIRRALQRANGGNVPERVVLLDFDTVIDSEFDWVSVFELPI